VNAEEEEEDQAVIRQLDSYVVLEYIKSSVDIILNLKFEEIEKRLVEKNEGKVPRSGSSESSILSSATN